MKRREEDCVVCRLLFLSPLPLMSRQISIVVALMLEKAASARSLCLPPLCVSEATTKVIFMLCVNPCHLLLLLLLLSKPLSSRPPPSSIFSPLSLPHAEPAISLVMPSPPPFLPHFPLLCHSVLASKPSLIHPSFLITFPPFVLRWRGRPTLCIPPFPKIIGLFFTPARLRNDLTLTCFPLIPRLLSFSILVLFSLFVSDAAPAHTPRRRLSSSPPSSHFYLSIRQSLSFLFSCQEHKHAPNLNQLHSIQFLSLKK